MSPPRARDPKTLDLSEDRARALAMNPVSRETAQRLDRFVELLLKWQRVSNLIADSSVDHLWTRHIADSLQLIALAPHARTWVDLGSGAGFPGLVLACTLADTPGALVHLIESNAKKAAFLREAARITGAAAIIRHGRAEDLIPAWRDAVDVVTARALAPLSILVELAAPMVKRGAKALFLKGQDVEAELTQATKCWNIEAAVLPSRTDRGGRIVEIRALERRNERLHLRDLP
jgi:16S rRNA (guanine527-N7)-methyltransferase